MPIYEYKCLKCTMEFELIQSMSDKPRSGCIYCDGPALRLVSSKTSFQLKGKGWFKNNRDDTDDLR